MVDRRVWRTALGALSMLALAVGIPGVLSPHLQTDSVHRAGLAVHLLAAWIAWDLIASRATASPAAWGLAAWLAHGVLVDALATTIGRGLELPRPLVGTVYVAGIPLLVALLGAFPAVWAPRAAAAAVAVAAIWAGLAVGGVAMPGRWDAVLIGTGALLTMLNLRHALPEVRRATRWIGGGLLLFAAWQGVWAVAPPLGGFVGFRVQQVGEQLLRVVVAVLAIGAMVRGPLWGGPPVSYRLVAAYGVVAGIVAAAALAVFRFAPYPEGGEHFVRDLARRAVLIGAVVAVLLPGMARLLRRDTRSP